MDKPKKVNSQVWERWLDELHEIQRQRRRDSVMAEAQAYADKLDVECLLKRMNFKFIED